MIGQRGGFVLGVVVGLLVGLSIALGVALYITKAPVPFVNKVPQRTAEQDQAELQRNRNWDPNAPLAGKGRPAGPASPASAADSQAAVGAAAPPPAAASGIGRPAPDPAAILAGAPGAAAASGATPVRSGEPFVYFVQTGAYSRAEEAEQQRARLALIGHSARITEREQGGRVVYRVRLGPFETRGEADGLQLKLQETKITSQLVRVERP